MTKTFPLLQMSLLAGIAIGLCGCDTVSNAASGVGDAVGSAISALDPTTWFGGGDSTPPPAADNGQPPSTDTAANTTPDLANLPAKPPTTTAADQQATAQSLAADGAQAGYSANALRAGTEASASPPPAVDVPPSAQVALNEPPSASAPAVTAGDMPPTTDSAPPSAQPAASPPPAQTALAAPPPSALTQGTGAVPQSAVAPTSSVALAPAAAPYAAPPPGAQPAVPAVPANAVRGGAVAMNSQIASDTALGFRPSTAPPLDPSINQWVSAPVIARYRQTANGAGIAPVRIAAVPAKGGLGMGGHEAMSGAVVTNLDAISTGPAGTLSAMNGGGAPSAVVFFPGDGATLSPAARAQVRAAADQFKAMGGVGSIRVVGHASSRTANMPVEKHLEFIFNKSQARANAVAQELIHQGVPATKVLIEAVGDSQPVYFESMPQGEEGNRRAEIFVQS